MDPAQLFPEQQDSKYSKTVAYFSMEFAIDQALKCYCGGLGYLAGSMLRSARELGQRVIGVGILWTYGYYDEVRDTEGFLKAAWSRKHYSFLNDTGVMVTVTVHDTPVHVKSYWLKPEVFGCSPLLLLSTDIPENDFLARTITQRLYDPNESTRIAQSIVLGRGGAMSLEALNITPDIYHLNEGHALPLIFQAFAKYQNRDQVQERLVFTTHTPEPAGNEVHAFSFLNEMSFFCPLNEQQVRVLFQMKNDTQLNYTLAALRMARKANAVSAMHAVTARKMWAGVNGLCEIIGITNAQNRNYWQDNELGRALNNKEETTFFKRKQEFKKELFKVVADQCGKLFNEHVLTIVWARRFSGYKRPGLLLHDMDKFRQLARDNERPIQFIWAGKPYPEDEENIALFNRIMADTQELPNCAVLLGYDLKLSTLLKKGSDVWLNTPRLYHEASGTSGMTAAMNGSLNLSMPDGWVPEFAADGVNCFLIRPAAPDLPEAQADEFEAQRVLEAIDKLSGLYYGSYQQWFGILCQAAQDVIPAFESGRMAGDHYRLLYDAG